MISTTISRNKLILFSITAILLFLCCIEFSARLILCLKKNSFEYLLYGFKTIEQKQRLQKFEGHDGEPEYYKSTPSTDKKNPVNSVGFRGPEITTKQKGIIRIICLGSSTTYGTGLNYCDTYPAILQKKLNKTFGEDFIEVINGGQPGLNLTQISTLIKHEISVLKPDIVLLMNINNNLKAPGFWFVDIKHTEKNERLQNNSTTVSKISYLIRLKAFLIRHSGLALLIQETIPTGVEKYFMNFDWKAFADALMKPDNIWQTEFRDNLNRILKLLSENNPAVKIILLREAVNTIKHPELEAPFNKANEIMKKLSRDYNNVDCVDIHRAVIDAAKRGENVWQSPFVDPLHLQKEGNEIIADVLITFLASYMTKYNQSN